MISDVIEADKLKQLIDKIETIEEESAESADLLKDAFNEAKSMDFDVKIIKHVLKFRKKDKDTLQHQTKYSVLCNNINKLSSVSYQPKGIAFTVILC